MFTSLKPYWMSLVVILLCHAVAGAHPWGGLVVDENGNIYFTFICPMTDDNHYACVWKLDGQQQLRQVLKSNSFPSDIILSRSTSRTVFGAERSGSAPNHLARLWQLNQNGNESVISPTNNPGMFHIQAYAVNEYGTVFFARDDSLFKRTADGEVRPADVKGKFERIDAMAWGPSDNLYIIDRDRLRMLAPDGTLNTLATGLKEEDPEYLPFSGANIIFDLTVDRQGNAYIAYYGNRRVLKIDIGGRVSTFLQSEEPWSPHGVDIYNGDLYVLESTVGSGSWWKFWEGPEIIPRIRKVDADGSVTTLYEYPSD